MLLRIPRRQRHPVGRLAIEADLEGILAGAGQGNVENQHCARLYIHYPGWRLSKLHRAFAAEQLGAGFVDEADPDGMDADLGATPADPQHQVSAGIYGREVGEPNVLEYAEHAELALLVDQGVIGDDGKIEMQGSADSN